MNGSLVNPTNAEFGLMLDIGRKRFEVAELKSFISMMARNGLCLLHLHFSENGRFGLESDWVRPVDGQAPPLSKQELADVVGFAHELGIDVMGEIGMPGHMGAVLKSHPHLCLQAGNGRIDPNALDLTHPEALPLCLQLIEEFLPHFSSKYWHIGADEYLGLSEEATYPSLSTWASEQVSSAANVRDAKLIFLNQLIDALHAHGKLVRAWGDELLGGKAVRIHPGLLVEWWSETSPVHKGLALPKASDFISAGHKLINCSWTPLYFVLADADCLPGGFRCRPADDSLLNWRLNQFQGSLDKASETMLEANQVLGAKFQVWCDNPQLDVTAEQIEPMLKMLRSAARAKSP